MTEFVDPHLHVWDTVNSIAFGGKDGKEAAPVHDAAILGPPAQLHPTYSHADHMADMEASGHVSLKAAVHVEAIPSDGLKEAIWAVKHLSDAAVPFAIVARVDLSSEHAEQALQQLMSKANAQVQQYRPVLVRGIRMILNFEPTWPKVPRGDLLTDRTFQRNYGTLAKHNLSFDLQANPHQLLDAAALAAKVPAVPLIVNHMGCLKLPCERATEAAVQASADAQAAIALWRKGMQALADAGDHVYVKISMLCYTDPNWDSLDESVVPSLVKEVLAMFGTSRCMFASNYPVDKSDGWSPARLFAGFAALCDKLQLSDSDRRNLYVSAATAAYRLSM